MALGINRFSLDEEIKRLIAAGATTPSGPAGGSLAGSYPNPTLVTAALQEVIALADLTDVSGSFSAGSALRRNNTGFKPSGLRFSMTAYGVVPCLSSDTVTSAANSVARDACTTAAQAAGDGSTVELDWIGVASFSTAGTIYPRLSYVGTYWNTSKLMDGATAGTHVWQTLNFATLTQTVPASFNVGAWEFSFCDHVIDGNKANNASGGHALAIYGYGYFLDNLILQSAKSAGWWSEWNNTGEPLGNGGSQHQRAFYVGTLRCISNDCANVAAVNTRLSESRGAITGGQACLFGPGDSWIDYIELYRDGSVTGIGLNQGGMDMNAGTFGAFDLTIGFLTVWLNHSKGAYLAGGNAHILYAHVEGATTNIEIASQGVRIMDGKTFFPQPGGTNVLISSGFNGGYLNLSWGSAAIAQTHLNITGGTCQQAEIIGEMDFGHAVAFTATAGTFPSSCRRIALSGNNYGGATVTAGWLPLEPGSTTLYNIEYTRAQTYSLNGVGYGPSGVGAGGAATQATSKATGVTVNAASGAITMNAAALAAATSVTFTVTSNRVVATDVVLVSIKSGATANSYQATVDAVAAGSFNVSLRNISAGTLSEAVVLNFAVVKAVAS